MKTAMYIRLSQNRDHDEDKPQRQIDACERWLEAHGITDCLPPYQDDDRSAYRGKPRPEFKRLLADIRGGEVTSVIALHVDRLLRNMTEMETLIALVEKQNCEIHTVESGELDLTTSAGRGMARMMANFATIEVERKSERHLSKASQMRTLGKGMGRRPFGWASVNGGLLPEKATTFVTAEQAAAEAKILREGISDLLEGKSLHSIAESWNGSGVTTTAGHPWTLRSVREVLMRWRNCGLMVHLGEVVEGVEAVWQPVATREEVEGVRGILNNSERRTSPGPTPRHLLTNIATCGKHGTGMHVGTQYSKSKAGTKKFSVYRCNNAKGVNGDRCFLTIKADTLESAVHQAVRQRLVFGKAEGLAPTEQERAMLSTLRSDRGKLVKSEQDIAQRVGSGEWSILVADAALKGIRARRAELGSDISKITRRYALASLLGDRPVKDGKVSIMRAAEIGNDFKGLDLSQQRTIIRSLFNVTVDPGRDPDERIKINDRT